MLSHRTTARGIVFLIAAILAAGATARPVGKVPTLVFPVVGPVQYSDDFGDPRPQGRHEGNDLLAPRKAIAVAAEAGRITFWTSSASAGCMLYLHGESGTTYLYIHLNNDLGSGNDNRGTCIAGTAYAPGLKDGAHVEAGQPVGFVGDSGDANGVHPHLHFEVHPHDGAATDPFPSLKRAQHLLFVAAPESTVTLSLTGQVVLAAAGQLKIRVTGAQVFPATPTVQTAGRTITVSLPSTALVDPGVTSGKPVVVLTEPTRATLPVRLGLDGALSAARVALR